MVLNVLATETHEPVIVIIYALASSKYKQFNFNTVYSTLSDYQKSSTAILLATTFYNI